MRIEAIGISAGYGKKTIINQVSLRLQPGELVALIGPNGSGKSTLLRALSRSIPLSEGALRINGKAAESYSARDLAREIAFVPQTEPALFDFPVREVVLMGRNPHVRGISGETTGDYAESARAMAAADVLQLADRPITELSGGEHRRVLIA